MSGLCYVLSPASCLLQKACTDCDACAPPSRIVRRSARPDVAQHCSLTRDAPGTSCRSAQHVGHSCWHTANSTLAASSLASEGCSGHLLCYSCRMRGVGSWLPLGTSPTANPSVDTVASVSECRLLCGTFVAQEVEWANFIPTPPFNRRKLVDWQTTRLSAVIRPFLKREKRQPTKRRRIQPPTGHQHGRAGAADGVRRLSWTFPNCVVVLWIEAQEKN